MKRYLGHIKFLGALSLVIFLYAFSAKRHAVRPVKKVVIEFVGETRPFLTENMVNKLLIQNQGNATNLEKETLVLNKVETALGKHKIIIKADVYLTVNGILKTEIRQRTPIARANTVKPFYIDTNGEIMPFSKNYTARVPLVDNIKEKDISEIFPLLEAIQEDDFLKQHITTLSKTTAGHYLLRLRVYNFAVDFGRIKDISRKIRNFKAFYQKALKDKSLEVYEIVDLRYSNQVVCIRKESKSN